MRLGKKFGRKLYEFNGIKNHINLLFRKILSFKGFRNYYQICFALYNMSNPIFNKLNYFTNQLHHVLSRVKSVLLLIEIAFEISPLHAHWSSLPFMPIYCTRGIRKCQSKVINYLTMFHILADVHWLRFSKIKFFL